MDLIPLHSNAWVEMHEDHATVSWPGGIYQLDYEAPVVDLLAVVALAIHDLQVDLLDGPEVRRLRREAHAQGYEEGWEAARDRRLFDVS